MTAQQQTALNLNGGACNGLPPTRLKLVRKPRVGAHTMRQCSLPLQVPDLDTTLRSRQPETRGKHINLHGYDRFVAPVNDLAIGYYELFALDVWGAGKRQPNKQYIEVFDCLFSNFLRNSNDKYWVRVPRRTATRKQNGIGIKALINVTDWLANTGRAELAKGWQGARGPKGSGVMTSIRPADDLLRELRPLGRDCVGTKQTRPVIVLRDANKSEVQANKWSKFDHEKKPREAMQKLLSQLNKQWADVIVSLDNEPFEQCYFRAVFTQSFLLGGRIYEDNIQNLPQRDRRRLLFDGQHVAEVDYSGCQWRIMYALKGLVFSEDDDPYRLPGFSREAVKAAAQPLGFGKSIKAAIASLKNKQNPALKGLKSSDGKELFDRRLLGVDIDALAGAFLDKHRPIKDLLCSPDHALKMQREDAKLMADILKTMMRHKALAYPIHDSLITLARHRELAVLTMRQCFKKRYGFACPVDVKY